MRGFPNRINSRVLTAKSYWNRNNLKTSEHKGFQIQIHSSEDNFYAEIYRREKLLQTIRDSGEPATPFRSSAAAAQAAREWIDRVYPRGKVRYFGGRVNDRLYGRI